MRHPSRAVLAAAAALAACGLAREQTAAARFVAQTPWVNRGVWLPVDTHVHSRFSDGASAVGALVERARQFGCRAIAIADHADRRLRAATPEYQAEIEAARAANPDLVVLAGLEWNIPPHGGDEHATVLVPPGAGEWDTLAELKQRFDDYDLAGRPRPDAAEALQWLATRRQGEQAPVVIYNHPSRKDESPLENADDVAGWRGVNDLVVGFEGAPGHQRDDPIGSYDGRIRTVDRWDPVVADAGGVWDSLLLRGTSVHGAIAGSDFHNANPRDLNDPWPCEFAETWLFAPEATAQGVLAALRAGAAFAAHGRIAREVELSVLAAGLPRPAFAGEAIEVEPGSAVAVTMRLLVPDQDWRGDDNRIDAIEFVVATQAGTSIVTKAVPVGAGRQSVSHALTVAGGGLVVRARGRRAIEDGPDLMVYTNAIRVLTPGGS
jgi:hypothetical protein